MNQAGPKPPHLVERQQTMAPRFLIDGYNLLHAYGLPTRLGSGGLEKARNGLLAFIASHAPAMAATVVFDGAQASGPHHQEGLTVFFAKGEADDLLRELIAQDSAPKSLWVVSSDHAVQRAAKKRRANVVDASAFLEQLEAPPKAGMMEGPEKPVRDSEGRHWLTVFADIDGDPTVRAWQAMTPVLKGRKKKLQRGEPGPP